MNNFADKFIELENKVVYEQKRLDIKSSLKVFYGLTNNNSYRISFISSIKPFHFCSTEAIKITQGKESEMVYWTCFDFASNDTETKKTFFQFCDSLIEVIENNFDELNALTAVNNRYLSWMSLFKNKGKMKPEFYQGLYGELYFLYTFLFKMTNPDQAINAWVGPDGFSKDFSLNNSWYEIKTLGVSSKTIKINSLTQLDSKVDGHLVKITVEKVSNEFESELCSVPLLYNKIFNEITNNSVRSDFVNKVLKYGYVYDENAHNCQKFDVKNVVSYNVNSYFPKLTNEQIHNNAISDVTYELLISALDKFMED